MKAIRDDNLKTLKGRTKIQYIWDYYKLPLAIPRHPAVCTRLYPVRPFYSQGACTVCRARQCERRRKSEKGLGEDFLRPQVVNLTPYKCSSAKKIIAGVAGYVKIICLKTNRKSSWNGGIHALSTI